MQLQLSAAGPLVVAAAVVSQSQWGAQLQPCPGQAAGRQHLGAAGPIVAEAPLVEAVAAPLAAWPQRPWAVGPLVEAALLAAAAMMSQLWQGVPLPRQGVPLPRPQPPGSVWPGLLSEWLPGRPGRRLLQWTACSAAHGEQQLSPKLWQALQWRPAAAPLHLAILMWCAAFCDQA